MPERFPRSKQQYLFNKVYPKVIQGGGQVPVPAECGSSSYLVLDYSQEQQRKGIVESSSRVKERPRDQASYGRVSARRPEEPIAWHWKWSLDCVRDPKVLEMPRRAADRVWNQPDSEVFGGNESNIVVYMGWLRLNIQNVQINHHRLTHLQNTVPQSHTLKTMVMPEQQKIHIHSFQLYQER